MGQNQVITVTGATGRVGRAVTQRLIQGGHVVRAVVRDGAALATLRSERVEVRPGSLGDREFLTSVLRDSAAAFVLTPVDFTARDVNSEQRRNVEGAVAAIRDSGIKNVVLLSSWGAELAEPIGGIIGCHWFERLLDEVPGLNAVYLRPVWFMENFLFSSTLG